VAIDSADNRAAGRTHVNVVEPAQALEERSDEVAMAMHELAHLLVSEEMVDHGQYRRGHFLAAPLMIHGEAIGALNLYSGKPSGFTALDDVLIALFTGQTSVAVANARVYGDAVRLTDQLREAISSRAVIEQAKGVLMARHGIEASSPDIDRPRSESSSVTPPTPSSCGSTVSSTARRRRSSRRRSSRCSPTSGPDGSSSTRSDWHSPTSPGSPR
jgi:hypothetical protein